MRITCKYKIEIGKTVIELPVSSKVVMVGVQGGTLNVWIDRDADPACEESPVSLYVVETDFRFDESVGNHVGSARMSCQDVLTVLHVYSDIAGPTKYEEEVHL